MLPDSSDSALDKRSLFNFSISRILCVNVGDIKAKNASKDSSLTASSFL